jgi:oxygen-independent coproporphyrinogen-3 oxidase
MSVKVSNYIRKKISRQFIKENNIVFDRTVPSNKIIEEKFRDIKELGIYLHIPFCDKICPYCPYNKELFHKEACHNYVLAVLKEIDMYLPVIGSTPVTSFYIGGGTPTSMLGKGIEDIIDYIYKHLNVKCHIHMESHPNHLTAQNLDAIEAIGVKYLSVGVEALQDHHLKSIKRTYTVNEAKASVERAVERDFKCVNIDFMIDLPGQSNAEIGQAAREMVKMGVDQIATYPLFRFQYTGLGKAFQKKKNAIATMFRRRRFLKILEENFYNSGYERSSVWAFTKKGVDKYCSVTVPLYLGLGASGSSYLKDIFYVNTFRVSEYMKSIQQGRLPIALSVHLSDEMQMAGWLYWRLYETKFKKSDFQHRFSRSFDKKYGRHMKILESIGFLSNGHDQINLSDRGTYWIHAFEDFFSIDYINKLWGTLKSEPWPEKVIL